MSDPVRRLLLNLPDWAVRRLFRDAELDCPTRSRQSDRNFRRQLLEAIATAPDAARNRVESVAGEVVAFSDKTVFADIALRAACEGDERLTDLHDSDVPLMERALLTLLDDAEKFGRARNLAAGLNWREGRYHRGFILRDAGGIVFAALEDTGRQVAQTIQRRQGGRKVQSEAFSYSQPEAGGRADTKIHHVAIYVEAPAISSIEFAKGSDEVGRVVRRPAKEIAIDFNPTTGRLDVAGYGIGGAGVLEEVAEVFQAHAVENAGLSAVEHRRVHLELFLERRVILPDPPDGMLTAHVHEFQIQTARKPRGRASFTAARGEPVYERLAQLRIDPKELAFEQMRAVTFEFEKAPQGDEPSYIQATLSWPNSLTFSTNASVGDRWLIEAWLVAARYYDPVAVLSEPEPVAA